MRADIKYYVLLLCLLCNLSMAGSDMSDYSFFQISLEEGLTQTSILSIMQDKNNTLWIGTKKGVNVLKQHKLKAYQHNPTDKESLPDNYINTLAEDSIGNIWAGSLTGLSVYDKKKDLFIRRYDKGIYSSFSYKDKCYFGGDNCLVRYDTSADSLTHYILEPSATKGDNDFRIVSMTFLSDNKLLLATKEQGIYVLNTNTMQTEVIIDDALHLIKTICVASDKSIYISTQNNGLYQYSLQGRFIHQYGKESKEMDTDFLLEILEYNGELWICTDGEGIKILNLRTREMREFRHIPGNKFTIPTNSVTTLCISSSGHLWAGSVRRGVFCIKETYIKTFGETNMHNPIGLTEASVISLYEESNGLMWIGTDGGGINLFNPKTNKFKHFPSTYGDKIISIANLNEKELLVSVYAKGMFIFHKTTGRYRPFTIVDEETNYKEYFYGYMPLGHLVNDNKIYIIGERYWIYNTLTKTFSEIKDTKGNPFREGNIMLAHSNSSFSLFMSHNKVYKINQSDDLVSPLFELNEGTDVVSLAYDQDHTVWVATNMGLGYYDMEKREFKEVHTKLFDSITFLIYDGKDRLWMGAQSQLFSYEISANKFTQINRSDGFLPNEILFAYQDTSMKHYIYLGGTNGLVQICTDIPNETASTPKIILDDVLMDGRSVWKNNAHKIEISHKYNSLSLMVQINAEDVLQRNLIKYSLVKDGIWQDFETYDTRHNLPASLSTGTYKVMVSCTTKSGDLTKPVKLVELVILPPWYLSTWFLISAYTICLFIVLGLSTYSYYKKTKQVRRKMHIYKQHVNEEKINFLINVNHELRTPLALIYAPLKQLIEKNKDNYNHEYAMEILEKVFRQATKMYHIVNTVLDINKLEHTHKNITEYTNKINEVVVETTEDLKGKAEEKSIKMKYELDEDISFMAPDKWKCQVIYSNMLLNAIRRSKQDSEIIVRTSIVENKFVRVALINKEIEFTEEELQHQFDRDYTDSVPHNKRETILYYSKVMLESMGGKIDAYNNGTNGATIYFDLPIDNQNYTEVTAVEYSKEPSLLGDINLKEYSVLVVEDTVEMNSFLCQTLGEVFGKVFSATNGEEALEVCHREDPNIVISDVTMPVMDGFELCRRIKTNSNISHIIVVLLTARCNEADENMGYKVGTDCYVRKPFDIDFLQTVIANLLMKRKSVLQQKFIETVPEPDEITYSKADEEFLHKMNEIIYNNISNEELNVKLITEEIGMSRATLYNKMMKITGMGVNDYVNRIRIERAIELMKEGNLSIKEISQEVGFAYPRYFSTSFKNLKGITPTQYKEKYCGGA